MLTSSAFSELIFQPETWDVFKSNHNLWLRTTASQKGLRQLLRQTLKKKWMANNKTQIGECFKFSFEFFLFPFWFLYFLYPENFSLLCLRLFFLLIK